MSGSMVDRATSDALIGPDWAMNMEICDILNRDPGQTKFVVKGLKKRIKSKNPKVQLLALTLLETVIKNCGDIIHMHVAEKHILNDMVKIVKKKPDFRVKEKILILIDTWQEAFGGPRARYPQYYLAYQELLHMGAVFPQRSEQSAPVFTPPQTQPLSSYPASIRSPSNQPESDGPAHDFPLMSMTDIQNARDLMDVLAEMLNALDPGNREGLKQEVIVDLVQQCRSYKQRLVHLLNSTSEEELLNQGLSLNDDLQRALAKHDAIAAGIAPRTENAKPKATPPQALVDVGDTQPAQRSTEEASTSSEPFFKQLALPAPSSSSSSSNQTVALVDLLSGDNYNTAPTVETPLAIVPVNSVTPTSSISEQNVLALSDMFATTTLATNPSPAQNGSLDTLSLVPVSPQAQTSGLSQFNPQPQQQQLGLVPFSPQQPPPYYTNGDLTNMNQRAPQYEQNQVESLNSSPIWNPSQQAHVYGPSDEAGGALPPPPWESQTIQNGHAQQAAPGYQSVPIPTPMPMQMPMPMPMQMPSPQVQAFYGGPLSSMAQYQLPVQTAQYPGYGYAAVLQPEMQYYDQRMAAAYGMSDQMTGRMHGMNNSMYSSGVQMNFSGSSNNSTISSQVAIRQSRPEDKFFGDLVSMAKKKQPSKPTAGEVGNSV